MLPTLTDAVQSAGWAWQGIVVWDKTPACRPQLGRFRSQAEFIVWASCGLMNPKAHPVTPVGVLLPAQPPRKAAPSGKAVSAYGASGKDRSPCLYGP